MLTIGDVAVVLASIFSSGHIVVSCLCHAAMWVEPSHPVHMYDIETR